MAGICKDRNKVAVAIYSKKNARATSTLIIAIIIIQAAVAIGSAEGKKHKKTIKQKLLEDDIIPDVIDDIPEGANVTVKFPSGVEAHYGNELTPTQVKDMPTVNWSAKNDELYMLAVLGPDVMTRTDHKFRSILYWLVVNIPGKALDKGETLAEYFGTGPPENTGLHRMVYLVYAQKDHHIESDMNLKNNSLVGRTKFSIREFAGQHHSKPIAANYYVAQYDDYVPILQKQLSGSPGTEN